MHFKKDSAYVVWVLVHSNGHMDKAGKCSGQSTLHPEGQQEKTRTDLEIFLTKMLFS